MNGTLTIHRIGPLTVGIEGSGRFTDNVRAQAGTQTNDTDSIDICFHFVDGTIPQHFNAQYHCGGNLALNRTDIHVQEGGFQYQTDGLFSSSRTDVYVSPSPPTSILGKVFDAVRKVKSADNNGGLASIADGFISYKTFWPLIHLELLARGAAFIHGSVVERDGAGTVLAGTGGAGKTSTCFELLNNPETRFLAEDFGIISESGDTLFSPRAVSVYASDYNHGQPLLKRGVDMHLRGWDRVHWRLQRRVGNNPIRKIPPADVLDSAKLADNTSLREGYFLVRGDVDDVKVRSVGTEEFVSRALFASFRELDRFFNILCQTEAVARETTDIPSIDKLMDRTRAIYTDCFDDTETYLLQIPESVPPMEVAGAITDDESKDTSKG